MVMAQSRGATLRRCAQRAASTIIAVESGPPETARTRAGSAARSANNWSASVSLTGPLAADTLLFPVDRLLHARRRARVFAGHFAEGGASELFLVEGRKRLAKPQQRVRRLGAGLEFLRHR